MDGLFFLGLNKNASYHVYNKETLGQSRSKNDLTHVGNVSIYARKEAIILK
jgi:hypothetical protein